MKPMYSDHMSGSDWGLMVFWIILASVFVVAVVWAITSVARREPRTGVDGSPRSGREILDERLARGEIDPDEYDRLRARLERPTTPEKPTPA